MEATNKKKIDMTSGPIMQNVLLFAIPIILGNVLQQLYTTVDTLVVGNFCGYQSLAAIGTSSQPVEVLLCLFLGIGGAVSIIISQYAGAGDTEGLKRASQTAIFFVFAAGILVAIIGYIAVPFILKFMNTPEDAWNAAVIYTRIMMLGCIGNIGYNMNAGILRGMGDSKASLWFLVISCVVNIVLDLVLVAWFGMDVTGAAIATVVAVFLSWLFSIWYIKKNFPEIEFTLLPAKCHKKELIRIVSMGLPIGLNNSLFSFGHLILQTFSNAQGSIFVAGAAVAGRVNGVANLAVQALSHAALTFAGQNYGAGKYERLRGGYMKIPLFSGAITIAAGLFFILVRMPLLRLFSQDTEVLFYASRYVVVMLLSYWMYAVYNVFANIVNGTGRIKYTTTINFMMLWVIRVPVAYAFTHFGDGTWLMLCYPASFGFGMVMMFAYVLFNPSWREMLGK